MLRLWVYFQLFRSDFRCRSGVIFWHVRCYFRVLVLLVSVLGELSCWDFCCYVIFSCEKRRKEKNENRRGKKGRDGNGSEERRGEERLEQSRS